MKKSLFLAALLSLVGAQTALAGGTTAAAPLMQVRTFEGCSANAGQSVLWVYQNYNNYGITSGSASYESVKDAALSAMTSQRNVNIVYTTTTGASFSYINANGACQTTTVGDIAQFLLN